MATGNEADQFQSRTESVMSYRTEMGNIIERRLEQPNTDNFQHMELLFKKELSPRISLKPY